MRPISYYLKLPPILQKLYLVFLIVKLSTTSDDLIPWKYSSLPLDPVIIDEKEE